MESATCVSDSAGDVAFMPGNGTLSARTPLDGLTAAPCMAAPGWREMGMRLHPHKRKKEPGSLATHPARYPAKELLLCKLPNPDWAVNVVFGDSDETVMTSLLYLAPRSRKGWHRL